VRERKKEVVVCREKGFLPGGWEKKRCRISVSASASLMLLSKFTSSCKTKELLLPLALASHHFIKIL